MSWSDPYPAWPDTLSWEQLFRLAPSPDIAAILHAARCLGATCVYDPATDRRILQKPVEPLDAIAYDTILRPRYLIPYSALITETLQQLGAYWEARAHQTANPVPLAQRPP